MYKAILFPRLFLGAIAFTAIVGVGCKGKNSTVSLNYSESTLWVMPDSNSLHINPAADLIRYGKSLIANTSAYLGPNGSVAQISNGMNCGNCHLEAGARLNAISLAMVSISYPKVRKRSGQFETISYRVNDCIQRSLNGIQLDSNSREMHAIVAYLKWLGQAVKKNIPYDGMGIPVLPLLDRKASVENGQKVFELQCIRCHGKNGEGQLNADSITYKYPPLWGAHSYNVSAGIYAISRLAGFIKYNMPYSTTPQPPSLSDEEAWDVAAYITSQERPAKRFKEDWPVLANKPFDFPFGPYTDGFSEEQHKYGPFLPIKLSALK